MNNSNSLKDAIAAIRAGNKDIAQKILLEILDDNPRNEDAWLWLTRTAKSTAKQREYLEKVLEIDPNHETALKALEILDKKSAPKIPPVQAKTAENPLNKKSVQIAIIGGLFVMACAVFGMVAGLMLWSNSSTSSHTNTQVNVALPPTAQVASEAPTEQATLTRAEAELPTPIPTPTSIPNLTTSSGADVEYIGNLATYTEGDALQFYFSLYDSNRNFTRANGTVTVHIVNEDGETVFTKTRDISEADFDFYTRNVNGMEFEAVAFSIPMSDIQKSRSSDGVFYLDFTTSDGIEFETIEDTIFGLPEYSDEELAGQSNQYFDQHATALNTTKRVDNYISVTVHRIGLIPFDDGLREEKYIRVDLTVENIGSEKIGFYSPDPVIIGKSANQFDEALVSRYDYENVFDSGDLYPGVKKSGALFFETSRNTQLDIKELIISTGLSSYYERSRSIGDGEALLYDEEYVFVFDVSNIQLR